VGRRRHAAGPAGIEERCRPSAAGPPGPDHDLATLGGLVPAARLQYEIDSSPRVEERVLVETPALDVFSNATMVLTKDGEYWVGTFSGDRILHGEIP